VPHLLSIIAFTPAAGAAALLFVDRRQERTIRWMATATAAVALLLSWLLWLDYHPRGAEWQFTQTLSWMPSIGASYSVGVDGFSLLLVLLTTLLGFTAVLASWGAMGDRAKKLYVAMLVLESGALGVFMTLDLLMFFLFWVQALSAAYVLVGLTSQDGPRRATVWFGASMLSGSVTLLAGILGLYAYGHSVTGAYTLDLRTLQHLAFPPAQQTWMFVAFFCALAIVAGVFPFHIWTRDAQAEAPAAVAVLVGALLVKIGSYGFVRLSLPILPDASRLFAPTLVVLALVGIVCCALLALVQTDLKRLVAYVGISQMGLALLGAFALTPKGLTGSIVQQVNHGISVGALLLVAGILSERTGTRRIAEVGGLVKVMPMAAAVFLVVTLSLVALPASNGFIAARLIFQGVLPIGRISAALVLGGFLLGAAALLWTCLRMLLGPARSPAHAGLRDLGGREIVTFVPLIALAVWIGLHPAPLLARVETSVARVVMRVSPEYAPEVADCLTQPPPSPAPGDPGLPAGMSLVAPCADGSTGSPPQRPREP